MSEESGLGENASRKPYHKPQLHGIDLLQAPFTPQI